MFIIKISEIVGEYCSERKNVGDKKGGQAIRELIMGFLNKEERIEISFEGVKIVTPSFIDEAFGKLALNYPLEKLRKKLFFIGDTSEIKDKINKSVELRIKQREKDMS